MGCYKIQELYLPNTVSFIESNGLLWNVKNIKNIFYLGTNDFSTFPNLLNLTLPSVVVYVSPSYPSDYFGVKRVKSISEYVKCTIGNDQLYHILSISFLNLFYSFILVWNKNWHWFFTSKIEGKVTRKIDIFFWSHYCQISLFLRWEFSIDRS